MTATYGRFCIWSYACLAALAVTQQALAASYCDDPMLSKPGQTCTPCDHAFRVSTSSLLNAFDEELKQLLGVFGNEAADLDGHFRLDDSGAELQYIASGDDMRDISSQMNMINRIIKNPSQFPIGSHLPSAELLAAYQHNLSVIRDQKFGSELSAIFALLLRDFIPLLTYYSLLGSEKDFVNIIDDNPLILNGRGALGQLQLLFFMLDGVEVTSTITFELLDPVIAPNDFITVGDLIGPNGDLDGDGYSNLCEYRHFKKLLCAPAFPNPAPFDSSEVDYVTAALDPTIVPIGCFEVASSEGCTVLLNGSSVVPPFDTDNSAKARFRRLVNTETGAVRYQLNLLHNLSLDAIAVKIIEGGPGEAGLTPIVSIANLSQAFWEVYLTTQQGEAITEAPAYIEVTRTDASTESVTSIIRGDNLGQCHSLVAEGGTPIIHSADEDGDGSFSLGELLEIIQFFNAGRYQCDGLGRYTVGSDAIGCNTHSSDFQPDFVISLSELLRGIQIFNVGHYYVCKDNAADDGYCLGQR